MFTEKWKRLGFDVCPPEDCDERPDKWSEFERCDYAPEKKDCRKCYSPGAHSFCATTHIMIFANRIALIPPTYPPNWNGYGDYRPNHDGCKIIIVPGQALISGGGLNYTGMNTYVCVIDDTSGDAILWLKVVDFTWTTMPDVTDPKMDVTWVALKVKAELGQCC